MAKTFRRRLTGIRGPNKSVDPTPQAQQGKAEPRCGYCRYILVKNFSDEWVVPLSATEAIKQCPKSPTGLHDPAAQPAAAQAEEIPDDKLNVLSLEWHGSGYVQKWEDFLFSKLLESYSENASLSDGLRTSREQLAAMTLERDRAREALRELDKAARELLQERSETEMVYEEAYYFVFKFQGARFWNALEAALDKPSPGTSQKEGE
jgi:hypothetical protein